MKTFGIISLVIGALNLLIGIAGMSQYPEQASGKLSGAFMFLCIGGLLLYFSDKNKKEKEDKDKWLKGS